jgi:hypothetical protein
MFRLRKLNTVTTLMILAAVVIGATLALTLDLRGQHATDEFGPFPFVTLGLTAEARQALQQSGDAFPANNAGFSAYYRVPDGSGGFSLDKDAVDQDLFSNASPTLRRAGVGTLIDIGESHTVGTVPINNIDGLTSNVNIYYDDQGWIVAYVSRGTPYSQVWQAANLSIEDPVLTDVSRTTLSGNDDSTSVTLPMLTVAVIPCLSTAIRSTHSLKTSSFSCSDFDSSAKTTASWSCWRIHSRASMAS